MITEDYVSFEIAKLLKEKGFDEPCYQYYLTTKTLHTTFHNRVRVEEEPVFNSGGLNGLYEVSNKTLFEDICSAPTLQMAMKWLREVHDLHIIAYPWKADREERATHWCCQVYKSFNLLGYEKYTDEAPKSYEEAVEDAIKYCLKNLI